MPNIGELLTSRPASCIQLLTYTQLLCKKNIVLIIIVIVLSFEVDGDVSLIYHKRIYFCKKNWGWFVCFRFNICLDGWTIVPLNGWKFPLTHFPTISRFDLCIYPNRWREKDKIRKFWPKTKIGDLLTSDDLLVWFNCIIWYAIFRGLQNTHFEWWTAMTEWF